MSPWHLACTSHCSQAAGTASRPGTRCHLGATQGAASLLARVSMATGTPECQGMGWSKAVAAQTPRSRALHGEKCQTGDTSSACFCSKLSCKLHTHRSEMAVLLCLTHGMKLSQIKRDFIFEPLLFSRPQLSHPSQASPWIPFPHTWLGIRGTPRSQCQLPSAGGSNGMSRWKLLVGGLHCSCKLKFWLKHFNTHNTRKRDNQLTCSSISLDFRRSDICS